MQDRSKAGGSQGKTSITLHAGHMLGDDSSIKDATTGLAQQALGLDAAKSTASSARFEGTHPTNEDPSASKAPDRCWSDFGSGLPGSSAICFPRGPMAIVIRYVTVELARLASFHPRRDARGLEPRRALHATGRGWIKSWSKQAPTFFCLFRTRGAIDRPHGSVGPVPYRPMLNSARRL